MTGIFAAYGATDGDEAVDPSGRVRSGWAALGPGLDRLRTAGFDVAARALGGERDRRGVVVTSWVDGRPWTRPLAIDLVPRVLPREEWTQLADGVRQRHRALDAFLADAYRAAGRRRADPDRDPEVVRAGILPAWVVAHSPGRNPEAIGLAWAGQSRAVLAGTDLLRTADGRWLVIGEDLRQPAGLGYALAARDSGRATVPGLFEGLEHVLIEPRAALSTLRRALETAAPPGSRHEPVCAVLVPGELDGPASDVHLLADALGLPLVRPADLWPRPDGGVAAVVDGRRSSLDVLYRRLDEAELAVHRTATGQPLLAFLAEAVRNGRLGLANVPGNGVADDPGLTPWVPALIRFYLGEEPLLDPVRTWVLADDAHLAQVRARLHELVLEPVGGYGGGRVVVGPECSSAELAQLQAEVAAAPHRFVAREPVRTSTAPTLVGGRLVPRHVDLRVFSVTGPDPQVLPSPLTRVAAGEGSVEVGLRRGSVKDTWLLG